MDWTKGFTARYYVSVVDKDTWRDIKRLEITGGTIKRSLSELRQSADIDVVNYKEEGEPIIRVWLDAKQRNDSSHTPLFTGLATSPGRNINGRLITQTLQCYSVLKPAADILLPRGWYAPANSNAALQIEKLLKVTNAPVEISGDTSKAVLKNTIVAEQNETNLSMIEVLLQAINWRMTIDGYGHIVMGPYPSSYSVILDSREVDIVEPQITDNYDWFTCPNVLRIVYDNDSVIYKDEDEDSRFSIQNRGREIWAEESSCNLNENETLAEYAKRHLAELQHVGRTINYNRRFLPDLNVSDIVRLNYPAQDIVGNFVITDQNISLSYGAKVSEEVMQL